MMQQSECIIGNEEENVVDPLPAWEAAREAAEPWLTNPLALPNLLLSAEELQEHGQSRGYKEGEGIALYFQQMARHRLLTPEEETYLTGILLISRNASLYEAVQI